MEKRDKEIFMQSPDRRCLAMLGKLLRRATNSVNGRIGSTLQSKNKRALHRQEARIHIRIWSVDPLHIVQFAKHKFCVSQDYIPAGATGRHVTRWKQVFHFFLVLQSRKRVAEPKGPPRVYSPMHAPEKKNSTSLHVEGSTNIRWMFFFCPLLV